MNDHTPHEPYDGQHSRRTALALSRRQGLATGLVPVPLGPEASDQSLHLRDLLRIVLKRKWTILAIFLLSATFSVVLTYLASPVYRATTTIQIERFAPRVFDYKDVTQSEVLDYDNTDFYNTQNELLKSRAVAERAVEDLGLRRNLPAASDKAATPAEEPSPRNFVHDIFNRLRGGAPPIDIDPAVRQDNAVVGAFQGSVNVEPVRRSRLVRLHFDSTDPFFAAKAVNVLAQAYINVNLERRFEASAYAKTYLEEKLLQTKARLEDSERELVRFSRELEIINIDEKQNVFSQNLQEFNTAVAKAEQERIRAEVLYRQAQDNPESLVMMQSENRNFQNYQAYQTLKQAKARLEAEYQEGLKVYKPAFPKMLALKGQIDEVDNQIKLELGEIRKSALAGFKAAKNAEELLRAKLGKAKQEMQDLQGRTIRYSILKREVDTNRTLYDGLLSRLKEVGVAGGANINNISVVDKAQVPLFPYKPSFQRNLSLGLVLGLLLGLAVPWLLEHMDDSIRFVEDVERETHAAVLGVVPMLKGTDTAKIGIAMGSHTEPTSAFAEAYRSVRTALQFSTASGAPRRLVVTSSSKHEGKSTTALALAINFAQMGKPVLIIDADLRNPVMHKLLKTSNKAGLSNYLSGNIGPLEVVRPTEIPHLFVMTTGPLPPNPVELLSSMKLLNLLSQCEEHFAHVIVDGPPVLGIADSIVLCNQVENSVFVIESGKTRKAMAKAAMKRLQQAGVNPLGVILTKIDAYHDLYGYHSYYYQYAANEPSAARRKEVAGA